MITRGKRKAQAGSQCLSLRYITKGSDLIPTSLLLQLEAGRNFEKFIVEYLRLRALFKHPLFWSIGDSFSLRYICNSQQQVHNEDRIDLYTCWSDRKLSFFLLLPFFFDIFRDKQLMQILGPWASASARPWYQRHVRSPSQWAVMGCHRWNIIKNLVLRGLKQLLQYHADTNSTW